MSIGGSDKRAREQDVLGAADRKIWAITAYEVGNIAGGSFG